MINGSLIDSINYTKRFLSVNFDEINDKSKENYLKLFQRIVTNVKIVGNNQYSQIFQIYFNTIVPGNQFIQRLDESNTFISEENQLIIEKYNNTYELFDNLMIDYSEMII